MEPCDFCSDEGKTKESSVYCISCRKYMCAVCSKSHAKFLPHHTLRDGTKLRHMEVNTCKEHIGQELEWFCEKDASLLCKACKLLEHKQCAVRKIEDILAEKDVKQEYENNLSDLVRLRDTLHEQQDTLNKELHTFKMRKDDVKEKVDNLQRELNHIFEKFRGGLENDIDEAVEMLHAKLISYENFEQKIDSHIRSVESIKLDECDDTYAFAAAIRLKQTVLKFKALSQRLPIEMNDGALVIKDTKLPSLINELTVLADLPVKPEANVATGHDYQTVAFGPMKLDAACQTELTMENHRLPNMKTENGECTVEIVRNESGDEGEVEQGSSEEMSELPDKLCFEDIKSCTRLKEKDKAIDFTNACSMPNGNVVVCVDGCIRIFDIDLQTKFEFDARDKDFKARHIVAVDNKSIAVSVPSKRSLQIIEVTPNVMFGAIINIAFPCDGLACFKKHFYVYSQNFDEIACAKYSGFRVISSDGNVLKRIQVHDRIYCFDVNKSGHIIYYGYMCGPKNVLKCVSTDGSILFQHAISANPNKIITDHNNNAIICCPSSGKVIVVKPNGSLIRQLYSRFIEGRLDMFTACFNRHTRSLIVSFHDVDIRYSRNACPTSVSKVMIYQINMKDA